MKIGHNGIALIQSFEGCKLKAYQDSVGIWTIGWGNTQYETGVKVKAGDVVTPQRANELFALIVSRFDSGVDKRLRRTVTQNSHLLSARFKIAGLISVFQLVGYCL